MSIIFELITALTCLTVGIIFAISSLLLNQTSDFAFLEGPAIFPFLFAVVVTILSVMLLAKLFSGARRKELFRALKNIKPAMVESKHNIFKLVVITVATFIYIVILMPWLHFAPATFIYLVVCTIYFGKLKPWMAVLVSAAFSAGVYYFFMNVLSIYLP